MSRISGFFFLFVMISCGVQDSSDKKDGIADSDHRIFVTSQTYTGSMGGLTGADSLCSQAASSAGLKRTYRAILSTNTTNAEGNLNITGGVYMFTDSSTPVLIAASGIDLWGTDLDPLKNAINRTEQYSIINDNVWTGTNSEGGAFPTQTCNNWASTAGNGFYGDSSRTSSEWTEDSPENCTNQNHLYCISTLN